MNTIYVVIGFIILVAGHQSSWLFVGGIGFVVGSLIADQFELVRNEVEWILFSLVSGAISGLLVVYLRRIMLAFTAFLSGGYVCYYLPTILGIKTNPDFWVYALIGACLSAIPVLIWGSLPVIVISSMVGSTLIIQNLHFGSVEPTGMFIVLSIFGLVSQYVLWYYSKPEVE
jgi:hypothetical protein